MAWLAIVGLAISAASQMKAGSEAAKAAQRNAGNYAQGKEFEAQQLDQIAVQESAAGRLRAGEERRQGAILESRARAIAAASGGGASDPTVVKIMSDLAGESEYLAATRIYEGEEAARRARMGAAGARYSGASAIETGEITSQNLQTAGQTQAVSTIFSGVGSMYGRYGTMQSAYPRSAYPYNADQPGLGRYR